MTLMKEITLRCRTITPLFMGGANQQAELRTQSFKGVVRWWWRAIKCLDDIEELRKSEQKIFGGTDENFGASKVGIFINYDQKKLEQNKGENLKREYNLNWRFDKREKKLKGRHTGIAYMLYSTLLPRKERSFIKDGFEFEIVLRSFDEDALKVFLASLWASIYLGGFGLRSRRGGGNLEVVDIKGNNTGLEFIPKVESSDQLADWIKRNFSRVQKIISANKNNFCFSYSNLSFSRFIISDKGYDSWIEALNEVGKRFMEFRKKHKKEIFDTAVFGLPVIHKNSKVIGGSLDKGKRIKDKIERRASPVLIKILKSKGKFFWLVLRFSGIFFEEGNVLLNVASKNKVLGSQKPDYRLIDEFWNELKNYGKEHVLTYPKSLEDIIEKIKRKINPRKIILFGSRARGDFHRKSDIDIAVESDKSISFSIHQSVDIVYLKKADKGLFEKIRKEGVVIYERKG